MDKSERRGKNVRACCVFDQTLVCFSGTFHPLLLRFNIYFRKSRAHICNDRRVIALKVTKRPGIKATAADFWFSHVASEMMKTGFHPMLSPNMAQSSNRKEIQLHHCHGIWVTGETRANVNGKLCFALRYLAAGFAFALSSTKVQIENVCCANIYNQIFMIKFFIA